MNSFLTIRKVLFFLGLTFLVLLCVFKPEGIDPDYFLYLAAYETTISFAGVDDSIRSLYMLVSSLSYQLGLGFYGVLAFYAGSAMILKGCVFYRLQYPLSALALYALTFYTLHEITQIRIALAIGVIFLFHHYSITKEKPSVYYAGVVLASLVHLTALAFFITPLLFMFFRKSRAYTLAFLMVSITIGVLLNTPSVASSALEFLGEYFPLYKMSLYIELLQRGEHAALNKLNILYLSYLMIAVFLVLNQKRVLSSSLCSDGFYYTSFIAGLSLFHVFSFFPVIAFRLSEMLVSCLPFLLLALVEISRNRKITLLFIYLYGFCVFLLMARGVFY